MEINSNIKRTVNSPGSMTQKGFKTFTKLWFKGIPNNKSIEIRTRVIATKNKKKISKSLVILTIASPIF